nr:hypothetical transcript [Hymenolepis microstoma]
MGRALSSGDLLDYKRAAALSREKAIDQPIHGPQISLLTVESGFTNFRGLINWGLIMLLVFGGKMALQNLITNGIIVDPFIWRYILDGDHAHPLGLLFISCSGVFVLFAYGLELIFYKFKVPNIVVLFLVSLNLTSTIVFPTIMILTNDWSPYYSCPCTILYTIVFLKLWSYAQVNAWCRSAANSSNRDNAKTKKQLLKSNHSVLKRKQENTALGKATRSMSTFKAPEEMTTALLHRNKSNYGGNAEKDIPERPEEELKEEDDVLMELTEVELNKIHLNLTEYPDNLTLSDLCYFMVAPTLCYELNFPRTFTIRKRFLLKRMLELTCLVQVIIMLIQQWMVPGLKSSVTPFIRSRWLYTLERLLTIAIPNHLIWLLGFYALFHSFLNFQAELMKFADRCFYEDWWNADSVSIFWSTWNIPVHRWCRRHIYKPLLIRGFTRFMASCVVFFVSAFFHEFMVSVPLKMPRMWAFLGMLGQLPYALLVQHFCPKGGKLGNMAVWLTLIVGQPLAIYMYFHDYYILRYHQ